MEPRDIFISYIEEDGTTARALAKELRSQGQSTWTYEDDGLAGISYLTQVNQAIESCRTFVLIASAKSVNAHQVIREVEQAHEREKVIIAVRVGLTHQQFIAANPILRMATGTAVTLSATEGNHHETARRITASTQLTQNNQSATPEQQRQRAKPVVTTGNITGSHVTNVQTVYVATTSAPVGQEHIETSHAPVRVSGKKTLPLWLWLLTGTGIGVQVLLGLVIFVFALELRPDSYSFIPSLGIVELLIAACGLVSGWWLAIISRASHQSRVPRGRGIEHAPWVSVGAWVVGVVVPRLVDVLWASPVMEILMVPQLVAILVTWRGLRVLGSAVASKAEAG